MEPPLKMMRLWEDMVAMRLVVCRSSRHQRHRGEFALGSKRNLQIVHGIQLYVDNHRIRKMAPQLPKLVLGRPVAGISAPYLAMLLSPVLLHLIPPPLAGVIACSVRRRQLEALAQPQRQYQQ